VESVPRLTLVTGLFDLAEREKNPNRRTPADYLRDGEFLLGLDWDVVFFVDARLADEVADLRQAEGLADRTVVVPTALEETAAYALERQIAAARAQHPLINGNPDKDTPLYAVLTWSKFEWVREAIELDPFDSSHFAWIDFAVFAEPPADDAPFESPADRVRLLKMRNFTAADIEDRTDYYAYLRGHVAGGYISASRADFTRLADLFAAEAKASLNSGFAPSEEQILPVLCLQEPGLFEFHHGNYDHLLRNYDRLRGSAENLLFQLRTSRDQEDWDDALELCGAILESYRGGSFDCDSQTLAELLDECFLAAYYARGGNDETTREFASLYATLVESDPDFREVFLRHEIRVRSNFALLGESNPLAR